MAAVPKTIQVAEKMEQILVTSSAFVSLDIETTGLSPNKGSRIIEIGAVKVVNGEIVDTYEQLIHPEAKIYKKTIELTGITNEMLEGKPVYGQVLPEFYQFIGNLPVVAHNAMFDWNRHLLFFFKKVGIVAKNEVIDTLKLSKMYHPELKKHALNVMCENYGISLDNHHRAFADALATAKLAIKYQEKARESFSTQGGMFSLPEEDLGMTDNSMMNLAQYETKRKPPLRIKQVRYWEKNITKKKKMQRVYVNTATGSCYFDIKTRTWYNKDMEGMLDFHSIEKQVLRFLNLNSQDDLVLYRN